MYVTFLLENVCLCFVTWKMEGERGKKSQKHYPDKGNKCW